MVDQLDVEAQAERLAAKMKHYLITVLGRFTEEANNDEIYDALSYALREEIMLNWLATSRSQEKANTKKLYYLSMEYLPGRLCSNNISNLNSTEIVKLVLQKFNCTYNEIIPREHDPGLGNGGLGRLAACFMDSLASLKYPAQGYGLRYQYGMFEQQIWDGRQIEISDTWLLYENPWEFRRDFRSVPVKFGGKIDPSINIHGDEIYNLDEYEEVTAVPYDYPIVGYDDSGQHLYNVNTLRLWSTKNSPRNFSLQNYNLGRLDAASENMILTDVLYPNDVHETGKRIRLKQEYLLVAASLQDIIRHYLRTHDNFRSFSDKVRIQINDTHPTLVIPELIRMLTKYYDIPWKMAVEITQAITGYTNHTILGEALEKWDQSLFYYLLPRQYRIIERLNHEFCNTVRHHFPGKEEKVRDMSIIENGKVRMANLAIVGSHSVNGVAALHTEILKNSVFKDFYELYPDKFVNVTNGVTQRRWLLSCNPELSRFITKRIGKGWITNFDDIRKIADFASDPESQEEFLNIKKKNKYRLIDFINQENKIRNAQGKIISQSPILDANSIFDVHIKRIHEYKRQLLNILNVIMMYHEILDHPGKFDTKRTSIFAGKAAAGYETAKDIIRLICCVGRKINRDPQINNLLKVIYIENYNVSKAEIIIPAADLSEQISTAGTEASGTGNMKLAMNGALTIGTDDGANIEMRESVTDQWWPFTFGASSREIAKLREKGYSSRAIYEANPAIRRAVDTLRDRTFALNDFEHQAFSYIYHTLIESQEGGTPDRFFVLQDLQDYHDTQMKVYKLYEDQFKWAEYALHNIAGMWKFSTDVSIRNYCEKIWKLEPFNIDPEILERIQHEYTEHDRCRIY